MLNGTPLLNLELKDLYKKYQKYYTEQEQKPPENKKLLLRNIYEIYENKIAIGKVLINRYEAFKLKGLLSK